MPYQTHFAFIEPKDRNARLWRYMDLSRLLSVIDKGALFFPSVATLSEVDPYEGEPALARIRAAQAQGADELRKLRLQCEVFKHLNLFNCWHMNDGESDAMWKLYVKGSEGVAIQSTVGRIISSSPLVPTLYIWGRSDMLTTRHLRHRQARLLVLAIICSNGLLFGTNKKSGWGSWVAENSPLRE
jgi:hypothetical protein